jgi:fumarate reductase flavoprotein subunit
MRLRLLQSWWIGAAVDEGMGGISITNDLARLDDPLCATVICDAAIWETAGKAAQIPPNPQLIAAGGTLHRADTIEALAEAAELPRENLAATVADYNDAVRFNRLTTLLPERSTRSGAPGRIETPPFFAIPICAGITNTMGGIAIDGHGRVKRRTVPRLPGSMLPAAPPAGSKAAARWAMSAGWSRPASLDCAPPNTPPAGFIAKRIFWHEDDSLTDAGQRWHHQPRHTGEGRCLWPT